ncbi:MAG: hypothetical protein IKB37_02445 [Rikenellaceae bacterium]|nr:hypothetical protein [Rikenellaceae bacterium]MBR2629075.1 hypothetical protein [Alistipes sp.]
MGMSSPKTKAEARKKIAELQGDIARYRANPYKSQDTKNRIASAKAEIARLRAQIPDLP